MPPSISETNVRIAPPLGASLPDDPDLPTPPTPGGLEPVLTARAHALMRTQTRETWLVPLLAVPLSRIVTSQGCTDHDLKEYTAHEPGTVRDRARRVQAIAEEIAASGGTRELTDEEAFLLMECSHDDRGIAITLLLAPPLLLPTLGLPSDLAAVPRIRGVGAWIAAGKEPIAMAALVAGHLLHTLTGPGDIVPRADSRFAAVTRAVGQRMETEGVRSWEQAVMLAHRYWDAQGWLELGIWQTGALARAGEEGEFVSERERAALERSTELRQHRAERKRLQTAASDAQDELRTLRSLRDKVADLREEAERLRVREAELVQARDRAVARAESLEAANRELERIAKEARRQVAALSPTAPSAKPERPLPEVVFAGDEDLPPALLAERDVFFFTGQLRKTSAESAGNSLRVLGARDIRTFCVHKGSLGPDTFPSKALVILDIRFVGHSQSSVIADRAQRSGAQYLAVRSGKGSLARTVAAALEGRKEEDNDPGNRN